MKSLLIISFSDIRADARVLKQVNEFIQDFEVTTCSYGEAPDGVSHHLQIPDHLLYWAYSRTDLILHQYRRAYWTNPVIRFVKRAMAGRKYDIVLADDIDPVPLALALEPRFGVHADLHEYAPKEREDLLRWRLFVGPFRSWICRKYLPQCASVTTVASRIAAEYSRRFGIEVGVVMNATPLHDLPVHPTTWPIKLVHSGACQRKRHMEVMLDAVCQTDADVTLDLYLTANEPEYLRELKESYGSDSRVRINDPVPYAELVETLNHYDLGVFVRPAETFSQEFSLPNKFFDYIQARLGIIISPSAEMGPLIDQAGNGVVTDGSDANAMVEVLKQITPEQVDHWKQRSDAVAEEFSAANQVAIWRRYLEALVSP